eukprot:scaffold3000_cov45-Phaeocystis_antarctica.AAC.4
MAEGSGGFALLAAARRVPRVPHLVRVRVRVRVRVGVGVGLGLGLVPRAAPRPVSRPRPSHAACCRAAPA